VDQDARIAIVGLGGIFPGAPTLNAYWDLILRAADVARTPPAGRWSLPLEEVLDPAMPAADKVYSPRACFVEDFVLDPQGLELEPDLFSRLDPLLHLALHAAREAWRDARTERLDRSRVGVVLASIALPTETASALADATLGRAIARRVLGRDPGPAPTPGPFDRSATGIPAGLVARALGLGGGAFTLDAACASSLYAIQRAAGELRAGRADAVLAGGLSRPDSLYTQMGFSQLRALSPSGTCAPFDARGDGLVVGEGCGVFVLKRLTDALDQGDRIHAVVAGVGLSNDVGGSLMAPDSEGQVRAMREAYRQAGWKPQDVDLIECHGTGTPTGDAVEVESLRRLWGGPGPRRCVIGSVKSNIGHLLAGAGAAGLAKVLLALAHGRLPPTANFQRANPLLKLEESPFEVLAQPRPWERRDPRTPRRAAVSGFGFGGINAHLLVEEWLPESRTAASCHGGADPGSDPGGSGPRANADTARARSPMQGTADEIVRSSRTARAQAPEQGTKDEIVRMAGTARAQANEQSTADAIVPTSGTARPQAPEPSTADEIVRMAGTARAQANEQSTADAIVTSGTARAPALVVAVVGLGACFGGWPTLAEFRRRVLGGAEATPEPVLGEWGAPRQGFPIRELRVRAAGFRIPPRELEEMLPQQVAFLAAAVEAWEDAGAARGDLLRTGVFAGAELDPNATNFHVRWAVLPRARAWARDLGLPAEDAETWARSVREASHPPLTANRVMGNLGGLVASRVARALRIGGPSFTLSGLENSGLRAVEAAVRALQSGEVDQAIAGAVDLAVDTRSAALLSDPDTVLGEGAAALVLKRWVDAVRDGDRVYALVRGIGAAADPVEAFTRAHAEAGFGPEAVGLLETSGRLEEAEAVAQGRARFARSEGHAASVVAHRPEPGAPTECGARNAAGGRAGSGAGHPCALASAASDIGFSGSAAGIASLVAGCLALHHEILPAGRVALPPTASGLFFSPAAPMYWLRDRAEGPRRAAIACRGADGTSMHVLIEARSPAPAPIGESVRGPGPDAEVRIQPLESGICTDAEIRSVASGTCTEAGTRSAEGGSRTDAGIRPADGGSRADAKVCSAERGSRTEAGIHSAAGASFTGSEVPACPPLDLSSRTGEHLFVVEAEDEAGIRAGVKGLLERARGGADLRRLAQTWWSECRQAAGRARGFAVVARDPRQLVALLESAFAGGTDPAGAGRCFASADPLGRRGDEARIALVYPGSGNHFAGMGRDTHARWPRFLARQDAENERLASQFAGGRFWTGIGPLDHRAMIFGQVVLGTMMSDLVRGLLRIHPHAILGYSLGETAGLFSTRTWSDRDEMLRRMRETTLFTHDLAGPCTAARLAWGAGADEAISWSVGVVDRPAERVRAALVGRARVHLLIVNTPGECVVGGDAPSVRGLVEALGCAFHPLEGITTVHCEAARPVEREYRELHRFDTHPPEGLAFYSGVRGAAYEVTRESAADSIVGQALEGFDYTRVVRRAHEDGIRVFLEMGPGASCSRMIGRILEGRPHLARSVCAPGLDGPGAILRLAAHLVSERIPVDLAGLFPEEPVLGSADGPWLVLPVGLRIPEIPIPPASRTRLPSPGPDAEARPEGIGREFDAEVSAPSRPLETRRESGTEVPAMSRPQGTPRESGTEDPVTSRPQGTPRESGAEDPVTSRPQGTPHESGAEDPVTSRPQGTPHESDVESPVPSAGTRKGSPPTRVTSASASASPPVGEAAEFLEATLLSEGGAEDPLVRSIADSAEARAAAHAAFLRLTRETGEGLARVLGTQMSLLHAIGAGGATGTKRPTVEGLRLGEGPPAGEHYTGAILRANGAPGLGEAPPADEHRTGTFTMPVSSDTGSGLPSIPDAQFPPREVPASDRDSHDEFPPREVSESDRVSHDEFPPREVSESDRVSHDEFPPSDSHSSRLPGVGRTAAGLPAAPPRALDRDQCLEFARGSIARVLGPDYAEVDGYPTRVRLPDEPLMLVDRIPLIEGEPRSLGSGRVVTEHDILPGQWYLDGGRIPTCIAVEAGQADLFLSGYLGIDRETLGLAVYRLLDAVVTFHDELPASGKTIRYDIRIERFFRQGDTHLFRFGFDATVDGRRLLTMRDGCAGFFTATQLEAGKGIVHTALDLRPVAGTRPADWRPLAPMERGAFADAQVDALRRGDLAAAFGTGFHGRGLAPGLRLPSGRMTLVHRIESLDPLGGRFGLGTIRGEADIHPDDWFLTCHFVDDRVMPGTLMYECCMHTLRVFLLRLGWVSESLEARIEPVPGVSSGLKCRGQVTGSTRRVTYEVAIKELGYGPEPYCIADALMYADGKPIVEMANLSLRYRGVTRSEVEATWGVAGAAGRDDGTAGSGAALHGAEAVRNGSEAVRNGSEAVRNGSEAVRNGSEAVRNG